jgi:hypothetical protein
MMKIKLFICCLCIMFLVGCRSTTLTCKKTVLDDDSIKINETISFVFKRHQLTKIIASTSYQYKSDVENNSNILKEALNSKYEVYKKSKGVKAHNSKESYGIYLELTLNIGKLTDEEKNDFDWLTENKEFEIIHKSLEKEGYSCR